MAIARQKDKNDTQILLLIKSYWKIWQWVIFHILWWKGYFLVFYRKLGVWCSQNIACFALENGVIEAIVCHCKFYLFVKIYLLEQNLVFFAFPNFTQFCQKNKEAMAIKNLVYKIPVVHFVRIWNSNILVTMAPMIQLCVNLISICS